MCVKAWKLHHSHNRMCKDAWIPTDRQTAALFVLDKVLLALQLSPTNQKVPFVMQSEGRERSLFRGIERDLDCVGDGLQLLPPEHSATRSPSRWAVAAQRWTCSQARAFHPLKKRLPQARCASPQQPAAAFRKDKAVSFQLCEVKLAGHFGVPSLS